MDGTLDNPALENAIQRESETRRIRRSSSCFLSYRLMPKNSKEKYKKYFTLLSNCGIILERENNKPTTSECFMAQHKK